MKEQALLELFDDLEKNAYNSEYHNFYYKEAKQIIRKHFEQSHPHVKPQGLNKEDIRIMRSLLDSSLKTTQIAIKRELAEKILTLYNHVQPQVLDKILNIIDPENITTFDVMRNDIYKVIREHKSHVQPQVSDAYTGQKNTDRIRAYQDLAKLYRIEEGTVREIFSAGIEWEQTYSIKHSPVKADNLTADRVNEILEKIHKFIVRQEKNYPKMDITQKIILNTIKGYVKQANELTKKGETE